MLLGENGDVFVPAPAAAAPRHAVQGAAGQERTRASASSVGGMRASALAGLDCRTRIPIQNLLPVRQVGRTLLRRLLVMVDSLRRILVELVIDMAFFFEMTDDRVLDPDMAVEMLESLSFHLNKMDAEERIIFLDLLRESAKKYRGSDKEKFILGLPEMIGLVDSSSIDID